MLFAQKLNSVRRMNFVLFVYTVHILDDTQVTILIWCSVITDLHSTFSNLDGAYVNRYNNIQICYLLIFCKIYLKQVLLLFLQFCGSRILYFYKTSFLTFPQIAMTIAWQQGSIDTFSLKNASTLCKTLSKFFG